MATEHIVFLSEDLGFYCADCMQKKLDDGGEYFHEIDLNYANKGDRLTCQDCEKAVTGNLPADSGYDPDDLAQWFIADSIQDVLG